MPTRRRRATLRGQLSESSTRRRFISFTIMIALVATMQRRCYGLTVVSRVSRTAHVLLSPRQPNRLIVAQRTEQARHYHHTTCTASLLPTTRSSMRLFSSSSNNKHASNEPPPPQVEISPNDHGTEPLTSLVATTATTTFHPTIQTSLQSQGLVTPTPIQAHAIPLVMKKLDVMASAATGSGKTLFFALPMLHELLSKQQQGNRSSSGPQALILNPTRELALQTANVLKTFLGPTSSLSISLATGGADVTKQRRALKQADIVVATPGRWLQFLDERAVVMNKDTLQYLIVDEADRMLDLGFEPQLQRIARSLSNSNSHQTILCSATFPPAVQRIAADFLKPNYYFVAAGKVGSTHSHIQQQLEWVSNINVRRNMVVQYVHKFISSSSAEQQEQQRVIVFSNTKDEAEQLGKRMHPIASCKVVTGDKIQSERNRALESFRSGETQILVATDVAARGLDVSGVGLVIQADAPRDVDTFVHRVGRTGRAGATGQAVAFMDERNMNIAEGLVDTLQQAHQELPPWLIGMAHVQKARAMEEEDAILAGSGGAAATGPTTATERLSGESSSENDQFSSQDFRRSAEAGSWGSDRDTSYRGFDEDAYSEFNASASIDIDDMVNASSSAPFADDDPNDSVVDDLLSIDHSNSTDDDITHKIHEKRLPPSKQLLEKVDSLKVSDDAMTNASHAVIKSLSERDVHRRLRFEYLGLFDFDQVSEYLQTPTHNGHTNNGNDELPRVLMVAEKPSIAKAIAEALSGRRGPRQKRGISRALPVYEFVTNVNFLGEGKDSLARVTVTSVVGHVFSLSFDEEKGRRGTDPAEYFHLPVVKTEEGTTGKLRVVDHLRALAGASDHLVLWLDCDAEGENIAHEVISVTRRALEQRAASSDSSDSTLRRIHRAKFSAITREALQDAVRNLVEPDAALSRAVDARQELDLRVGVAMTRLLTWRFVGLARQRFEPATKVVSYGPCQTPALSFCVDRAREIQDFEAKEFWKVQVDGIVGGPQRVERLKWLPPADLVYETTASDRKGEARVIESATYDESVARRAVQLATSGDVIAEVVDVKYEKEVLHAPQGLNTVAMLTAGSKAMGMSPKQMMNVAEKLYSAGFISYPRTETTRYDPNGFDVRKVLRQHSNHPEWGKTANYLLRGRYSDSGRPPQRGRDAGDHPPITTLQAATRDQVGGGAAWRVYDFITRTFLGSLNDSLEYTRVVVDLELKQDGANENNQSPRFQLEQTIVDSLGFAGSCPWVLRDIGAASRDTPTKKWSVGDRMPIAANSKLESVQTRPPRFLQEHELIENMDKNRIGTDASMATHVNNIVDRNYVVLCDETGMKLRPPPRPGQKRNLPRQVGRYLVPTPLGLSLIDILRNATSAVDETSSPAHLSRPAIRAEMEDQVKQIALGKLGKEECLKDNLDWFQQRYKELEGSLTRERVNHLGSRLTRTPQLLQYWYKLGAFEQRAQVPKEASQGGKSRPRGRNNHKRGQNHPQRKRKGNSAHQGRQKRQNTGQVAPR